MSWRNLNPFRPFSRTKAEIISILTQALAGELDCRHWDTFLRIPIKADPELEAIRIQCEAQVGEEITGEDGILKHSEQGRAVLHRLLDSLT